MEDDDIRQSEELISELVEFLSSISDAAISDPSDEDTQNNSIAVLSHIYSFLSSSSLDQVCDFSLFSCSFLGFCGLFVNFCI